MTKPKGRPRIGGHDLKDYDQWRRNSGVLRDGAGAPEGNTNRLSHGVFANRFLNEHERVIFESLIGSLRDDFIFNNSSDFIQVELVAVYFLKLGRAQEAGDYEAAERLDRMIRCHLKDLKATKISREGEAPKCPETTPAEWATALLERLRESEKRSEDEAAAEEGSEHTFILGGNK